MGSKVIVFLALFMATVLLISSEEAARQLAETSDTDEQYMETNQYGGGYQGGIVGYPGFGGGNPGGFGGNPGYGRGYGGGYGGYPGGRYGRGYRGGYGRHCRYGCCGLRLSRPCRCCFYAGEMAEPQN